MKKIYYVICILLAISFGLVGCQSKFEMNDKVTLDELHLEDKALTEKDFTLGEISIGMTRDQIIKAMGEPIREESHPNGRDVRLHYENKAQIMLMDGYVYFIEVLSPDYPTQRGLRVGDSLQRLIELYGEEYQLTEDPYTTNKTYSFTYGESYYVFHAETSKDIIVRLQVNEKD